MQSNWILMHCWWEHAISHFGKLAIHIKLNVYLPFDSAFLFWGIVPREIKIFVYIKTYMFITAFLKNSKSWK